MTIRAMTKRFAAALLWFVAVWMIYGLVEYLIGLPDFGGVLLGAIASALVFMDPTRSIWSTARPSH